MNRDVENYQVALVSTPEEISQVVEMFTAEVGPDFISHSELMYGRADDIGRWAPDLAAVLTAEFAKVLAPPDEAGSLSILTLRSAQGELTGFAVLNHVANSRRPFLVLEDMVVAKSHRGKGLSRLLMDKVEAHARDRGVCRIFLESGAENAHAHDVFERFGFRHISNTFLKQLDR